MEISKDLLILEKDCVKGVQYKDKQMSELESNTERTLQKVMARDKLLWNYHY